MDRKKKDKIEFLGLFKSINNPKFKPLEFDGFKNDLDKKQLKSK